ncbi:MAG TPA: PQQ-dependent sugar dehydrogenase [Baekduia sp.]|uniref:PQQ-dependent sugar dehydrogenase n=1 Tax=Baekduia sp. TaxID=2600305 RepID=UPI002C868F8D|nr:PQQ-dependent sugar dehydrogenase [Baekduia sp.]HMJ32400.1 PQQ-dependent sugar dehydrogenase [Baekduia sp.]
MNLRAGLAAAAVAATATAAAAGALGVAPAGAAVTLQQVGTFAAPVYVTAPPADVTRVFVVQRGGRIAVVRGGTSSTFLDLGARVKSSGSEQGLLSMAFAPDYATSRKFYVYYTAPPATGSTGSDLVVSELRATDDEHADPGTERTVLRIPHRRFDNHNGGQLQIGPDGLLWIGTGDGGDGNDSLGNAQKVDPAWNDAAAGHDARLGKLLRVDPAPGDGCDGGCTIPAGNAGLPQREIFAYGLRNPWRFSFDRATGDLTIGDVGQSTWEEVDFAAAPGRGAGANYGWNAFEGAHPLGSTAPAGAAPGITMPVLEKSHAAPDSFVSLAGGYVVRDPALPDLAGRYLYADTYGGTIRAATLAPGGATGDASTDLHVPTLVSFGEDACGRVYAVSLDGPVSRLAQSGACVPAPGSPAAAAPATPGGQAPGTDRTAPVLRLRAASRQRPWRTGVVRLRVSCDEACDVRVGGTFVVTRTKNGAGAAVVSRVTISTAKATLAAGAAVSVKAKVSARTRRPLLRSLRRHRRVTLRFTVTARDKAGNGRTSTARSRVVLR